MDKREHLMLSLRQLEFLMLLNQLECQLKDQLIPTDVLLLILMLAAADPKESQGVDLRARINLLSVA